MTVRPFVFAIVSLVGSCSALTQGLYGGKHWALTVAANGVSGTVEGDCATGTLSGITQGSFSSGVGTAVNFSMVLALQFQAGTAAAGTSKVVNVTDGLLGTDNITLTGTLNSGTHSETFKVVHLVPPDLFKCISSAATVKIQHMTLSLAALALAWLHH